MTFTDHKFHPYDNELRVNRFNCNRSHSERKNYYYEYFTDLFHSQIQFRIQDRFFRQAKIDVKYLIVSQKLYSRLPDPRENHRICEVYSWLGFPRYRCVVLKTSVKNQNLS